MTEAAIAHHAEPMLAIRDLHAWYGESHVLHGIDLEVLPGQVVTLLGRNGAGKSTTLKSIMGIVPRRQGHIRLQGSETIAMRPFQIARQGVAYCPEDRGIYATLDVREHLELPPLVDDSGLSTEQVLSLFPNLRERLHSPGSKLSGGEQQMLAIGRTLRTGARLLLLDEPTEGLAPSIVEQIGRTIHQLKEQGYTILLVEQNLRFALSVADHFYLIDHGRVAARYDRKGIEQDADELMARLGV
ncbi:ABC transporter ATP-binding protein [Billgrantia desiderata]|uniref:ABC transporter ATP-binding protein n=1 Tax=Billgrantia desiderata TaxID=52021 RepID=A0AAW4YVV4_9GAMM|nr:ABC transporter ATP-binding protein [Halomonas desiderata]MCE8010318.1 ABC transporter ATP-binding protein [Halomonas desiderata]MCE8029968.1 ABC transporter ATP-binding protein [Halomonas desiderata]MCE8052260.1 ABC transporter ATP-binding protein [Halomonas desiderata]NIC35646.1 ABC transporter ATP-binding protein [Halomonas desiderata]OUE40156.1 ABC transporter ATP-binding protein [Halomonas desiderata SP1]